MGFCLQQELVRFWARYGSSSQSVSKETAATTSGQGAAASRVQESRSPLPRRRRKYREDKLSAKTSAEAEAKKLDDAKEMALASREAKEDALMAETTASSVEEGRHSDASAKDDAEEEEDAEGEDDKSDPDSEAGRGTEQSFGEEGELSDAKSASEDDAAEEEEDAEGAQDQSDQDSAAEEATEQSSSEDEAPPPPPARRHKRSARDKERRRASSRSRRARARSRSARARSRSEPRRRHVSRSPVRWQRPPKQSEWKGTRAELGLPEPGRSLRSRSRRSRSPRTPRRSPRRRSPSPRSRSPRSPARPLRRTARSRWDVRPDPTDPEQKVAVLAKDQAKYDKKRRECYVGNLPYGSQADEASLRIAFHRLFNELPEFQQRYPDIVDPVRAIFFPPKAEGAFAFVELQDEVLCTTAVAMSGFEINSRPVRIGRPQHYVPPTVELPPLDLTVLRERGLLPREVDPECSKVSLNCVTREVYFGNLAPGCADEEAMRELVEPAVREMPEYNRELGPPIVKVSLSPPGTFCFIQFQNAELATRVIAIFDDTELFGRRIRVSRPSKYSMTVEGSTDKPPPPLEQPSAPLPPPEKADQWLAPDLLQVAAQELAAERQRNAAA